MNRLEALEAITHVLFVEWDPLYVRQYGTSDEYRSLARHVYKLLESDATAAEIARHLTKLCRESLALSNIDPLMQMHAAETLIKLKEANYRRSQ